MQITEAYILNKTSYLKYCHSIQRNKMDQVIKSLEFLPKYSEILQLIPQEPEADYILKLAIDSVKTIRLQCDQTMDECAAPPEVEKISFLMEALCGRLWERIHTGHFSSVEAHIRKLYTITNFFKIVYNLISSTSQFTLEKCSEFLDDAVLIGCHEDVYNNCSNFKQSIMTFLDANLQISTTIDCPIIAPIEKGNPSCDIPILDCPSVEKFRDEHFNKQTPVLLRNTIAHWPALEKWRDLRYILQIAGNRRVPIEIGSNYATDEWSQQLMRVRDFIQRQFSEELPKEVEYLAQHELFDQVPSLQDDIRVPDYCCLGLNKEKVDIKAWLGPKGTISPMHHDPKHNLLCQIFGTKKIILASPNDTEYLYPHDGELLNNTSQIDADQVDLEKFPLVANAKFYHLQLQEGESLYIPPKWWHYVRSEAKSFSVSFWWE